MKKFLKIPTPVWARPSNKPGVCVLTLGGESLVDPASPLSASPRRALQLLARGGQLQLPAHK